MGIIRGFRIKKMKISLWVDRINPERAIGNSPFYLVYGRGARLP
jgi:hypothetical protein